MCTIGAAKVFMFLFNSRRKGKMNYADKKIKGNVKKKKQCTGAVVCMKNVGKYLLHFCCKENLKEM